MNTLLKGFNPGLQFLLFMALVLTCIGIGSVAALLLGVFAFDIPLEEISAVLQAPQPEHAVALIWMNNVSQLFTFLVPVLIFLWLFGGNNVGRLMLRPAGWLILLAPLLILFASGPIDLSSQLNKALIPEGSWIEKSFKPMEDLAEQMTQTILNLDSPGEMVLAFISIAIIPAFCEEFAFRGVLQPLLAHMTKNVHVAIWLTAFLFSLFHMQFYGFIPRLLLGAVLGYLVIWSGSLWASVFAHFVNNAMAFILYKQSGSLEVPEDSVQNQWYTYALSAVIFIGILYAFQRSSKWPSIRAEYLGLNSHKDIHVNNPEGIPGST